MGRVCDGDEGIEGGDAVPCSASRVTFDFTLIIPPPPLLMTDEGPEWLSSWDAVAASLGGGEYMLRDAFVAEDT